MTWRTAARAIGVALIGGVLLGVGGRVVMRLIALGAGVPPGFSLGGTVEVIATGVLIGAPAALLWLAVRRWLGGRLWRGAAYGALVLAALTLVPPPAARSAFSGVGDLGLTLGLFGPLFVLFGAAVDYAGRLLTIGSPHWER